MDLRVFHRAAAGAETVSEVFAPWAASERWLFVSPHDDDAAIAAGLWIQALVAAGAGVAVAIVTDGRMGYTDVADRDGIVDRRKHEAERAYRVLGVEAVVPLGFADGSLAQHAGSRLENGRPAGLECALTRLLREVRPTRVVTADFADWHPDHRATFEGVRMATFHACGDIWPELGPPAPMPALYSFAVYAGMEPDFLAESSGGALARKLNALREFASQADIVRRVTPTAGQEYLRAISTAPQDPGAYRSLFAR
jgi:LmbE family N-acetylglucosaminyl deacetylase